MLLSKIKNYKKYFLFFILSIFISSLFIIGIDNREILNVKSDNNPNIIDISGFKKEKNGYLSTNKEAYVVIHNKAKYVKNITFSYKYSKDFTWSLEYKINGNKVICDYKNSYLLNKTVKNINSNVDDIKINIKNKNLYISNISIDNNFYIDYSKIIFIVILLNMIFLILNNKKYFYNNLDKLFLLMSISLCFSFIILLPKNVYLSFDDQIHFKNAINPIRTNGKMKLSYSEQIIINGNIYRDNDMISTKEEKNIFYDYINKVHKKTKNRIVYNSDQTALYNKFIYIPFYVGYRLGSIFNLNFTTCIIFSKFLNSLCYSFLFALAIKLSKKWKKIIFAIGLLPSNLYLASSFSYDPTIIASLTLASVLFFNIIKEDKINWKNLLGYVLLVIWGSLPKAIYCPLLLLLLFVNNNKFNNRKQAIKFKILIVMIVLTLMSTFVLPTISGSLQGDSRGGNTSVNGQIKFILSNPIEFTKIFLSFTYGNICDLFFGQGNIVFFAYILDKAIFDFVYIIYLIFLFYVIFKSEKNDDVKYKILYLVVIACIYCLICAAMYLSFTPVGFNTINGIQSRYFIPLLLLLLVSMVPKNNNKNDSIDNRVLILVPLISMIIVLTIISVKVI